MATIEEVWPRIERNAGREFKTVTGLRFTYRAPGQFIRVTRDGREINRVLSRTNFAKALPSAGEQPEPAQGPARIHLRLGNPHGSTDSPV